MYLGRFWGSQGQWHRAVFSSVIKFSYLAISKLSADMIHGPWKWLTHAKTMKCFVLRPSVCQGGLTISQLDFSLLFSS